MASGPGVEAPGEHPGDTAPGLRKQVPAPAPRCPGLQVGRARPKDEDRVEKLNFNSQRLLGF